MTGKKKRQDKAKTESSAQELQAPLHMSSPPPLALTIDYDKYLAHIEKWDISEAERREYITVLWHLLFSFAEMGFDIHPVQLAQDAVQNSAQKTLHTAPIIEPTPRKPSNTMLGSKLNIRTQIIKTTGAKASPGKDSTR